jgi:hypothetical protein
VAHFHFQVIENQLALPITARILGLITRRTLVQINLLQASIMFGRKGSLEQAKPIAFGFTTQRSLIQIRLMEIVKLKRASVFRGPLQKPLLQRNLLSGASSGAFSAACSFLVRLSQLSRPT